MRRVIEKYSIIREAGLRKHVEAQAHEGETTGKNTQQCVPPRVGVQFLFFSSDT